MLPFSREIRRLEWLKRSLTVYRLAFGQPRQEDLLEYLHSLLGTDIAAEDLAELEFASNPSAATVAPTPWVGWEFNQYAIRRWLRIAH